MTDHKMRNSDVQGTASTECWIRNASRVRRAANKTIPLYERIADTYTAISLPTDFRALVDRHVSDHIRTIPYHPGGSGNMFNGLMPMLAIMASVHIVLTRDGWTTEQIGRLNYDVFYTKFRGLPAPVRGLMRFVMVSPLLTAVTRKANRAMRESLRRDTFFIDYAFSRKPVRCTTMTCTQCGMVTYMRDNDLSEMLSYCNVFDYAQADACGMGLVQPSCIGEGDMTCTYLITGNPADTQYPKRLTRMLALDMGSPGTPEQGARCRPLLRAIRADGVVLYLTVDPQFSHLSA